jgi:ribA/ribD-fused uncharacterized protein
MIGPFRGEYFFLSNFYPCEPCAVEYLYQAAKTNSPEWQRSILEAGSAAQAKRLGRKAPLRNDWNKIRLQTMEDLVTQKFFANPDLAERLLQTGEEELVEVNWWGDTFWGVSSGVGENNLGKILMKVRSEIRALKKGVPYV